MENEELSEGKKIKIARIIKGLSQRELAEMANVSYTVVNEIENDKRTAKSSTIEKIKNVLEIK